MLIVGIDDAVKYTEKKKNSVPKWLFRILLLQGIIPHTKTYSSPWFESEDLDIFFDSVWDNIKPIEISADERILIRQRIERMPGGLLGWTKERGIKLDNLVKFLDGTFSDEVDSFFSRPQKLEILQILKERPIDPREYVWGREAYENHLRKNENKNNN